MHPSFSVVDGNAVLQAEIDIARLPEYEPSGMARMRYKKLGYVGLNVSSLERSRPFYEKMVGLQHSGSGDGCEFFRHSNDHHNIVLYESPNPGLRQIGWELEDDETLAASFALLQARNVPVRWLTEAESSALHLDRGFCLVDPTGVRHDYYSSLSEFALDPWVPTVATIQRLGHVVLRTDAYAAAIEFALKTQNFRVSDSVRGKITFMRCFPSPFHHGVGIANTGTRGLHHVNFMVDTIDDVGRALARFKANDVTVVYGPGRHPPSDSVFLYFLDPDGLTLEFSFGMEQFPERGARKARVFEPVAALDYWRSYQDKRTGAVGAIDPAGIDQR